MKIVKLGAMAVASTALLLGGAGVAAASAPDPGASASGAAANSPGVLSGNVVQVPVHVPVNVCGNSVNVIALLNPAFGNVCVNS
ncbi:chaplin [Streptomyces sp. LHD-70]|uniref:chaplin n=1 Tax=Streptomyces sp. LHD-70 TaxID=3072140 RepID=UPI00280CAFE8|nr:chaplin [Streptomyces sp. LHD-70]MDQ8707205.1 chaplin [Streptomyces sp. LHD-70]